MKGVTGNFLHLSVIFTDDDRGIVPTKPEAIGQDLVYLGRPTGICRWKERAIVFYRYGDAGPCYMEKMECSVKDESALNGLAPPLPLAMPACGSQRFWCNGIDKNCEFT